MKNRIKFSLLALAMMIGAGFGLTGAIYAEGEEETTVDENGTSMK